jgi:hypothetical protein
LQQISASNPFKAELAHRLFAIGNNFDRDIEALGQDRRWSAEHKREKSKGIVQEALRALDDAQRPIADYHKQSEAMRGGIKMPSYDKTDVVAALNRKELRDLARTMTFGQLEMRMIGAGRSVEFIDALLELEPWASGINVHNPNEAGLIETAKQSRLADLNGPLMTALEARATTESEIMMVANVVRNDITSAATQLGRAAA